MADEEIIVTVENLEDEYDNLEFIRNVIYLHKYMDDEEADEFRKELRKNWSKSTYDEFVAFEKRAVATLKKEGKIKD